MRDIRIVLTGGGTGGHINPLAAVATELRRLAYESNIPLELSFVGNLGGFGKSLEERGIKIYEISGAKVRRYASAANILEGPKLIIGFLQALWRIFLIMPDAVFSKGGSGSVATVLAARFFRIPVFIHESDSVASATTKFTSRFANRIFLSFEKAIESLPPKAQSRAEVVGNPIRPELLAGKKERRDAKIALDFDPDRPLMLVLGGSQGSVRINNLILASLHDLVSNGIQILHQTGEKNFSEVASSLGSFFTSDEDMFSAGYHPVDFINSETIADSISAADIIVSRAGGSIFEFAVFGRASILIPLPEAASDHQRLNALACRETNACAMLEESEISVPLFTETIFKYLASPAKEETEKAALKFGKPDAASKIAQILLESA